MADPQLYTATWVLFNDNLLTEEASITIDKKSGLNPVYTVSKGFAGMAVGANSCEMTIESAAPAADFEVNPDPYLRTGQLVKITCVMSGRTMSGKMFLTDVTYSHAVNQESKLVMKLMGAFEPWA